MTRTIAFLPGAIFSLGLMLLIPAVAAAQTPVSNAHAGVAAGTSAVATPAFSSLVRGTDVWITTLDGTRRQGRIVSLSPTGITVDRAPGTPVPFDRILKVQRVTHRLRHSALIGLIAGAGFGLVSALPCKDDGICAAFVSGLYTGIGAGLGAAVGTIRNADKRSVDVIYEAERRTTTVALAPILSSTRKGFALSMTWR